jgi:hypothetical protein
MAAVRKRFGGTIVLMWKRMKIDAAAPLPKSSEVTQVLAFKRTASNIPQPSQYQHTAFCGLTPSSASQLAEGSPEEDGFGCPS